MNLKKAILRDFDTDNYTAIIEVSGSRKAYLENVTVAKNIPSGEMTNGRYLTVLFYDEHNARDAVVIAVYV